MRLFPQPWEGLHPAYPKAFYPLPASDYVNAPIVGGWAGLLGTGLGALLRSRPEIGLTVAAYTTVGSVLIYGLQDYVEGNIARPYLQSQSIEVPRRRLFERTGFDHIDYDDIVVSGMGVGLLVATLRRRPWTITGFSRFAGAASFGAVGATLPLKIVPWRSYEQAVQRNEVQLIVAQSYEPEIERMIGPEGAPQDPFQMRHANTRGSEGSLGEMHQSALVSDLDWQDPRPHIRDMDGSEPFYKPLRNYAWIPTLKSRPSLLDHQSQLRGTRDQMAKEAELYWHRIATKEADTYDSDRIDPERQASLAMLNVIHANLWLSIAKIDWMLADTNKILLQINAMEHGKHWIPPLPADVSTVKPSAQLLDLLSELFEEVQTQEEINKDLSMLFADTGVAGMRGWAETAGYPLIDPRTGKTPEDDNALVVTISHMFDERRAEQDRNRRVLDELMEDARRRSRGTSSSEK